MPLLRCGFAIAAVLIVSAAVPAAEPVRNTIDAELAAAWKREQITPAARSNDAAFLRRIYLDLVGTIPNHDETVAFLADTNPQKREKLIDTLMADPRFGRAQADVWDLAFFGRHPANYEAVQKRPGFKEWLSKQFATNVPADTWVRELLLAETPGPETFYVQYRSQPEEAAVAISRLFLGTQMQCARCHDHPYDIWTQKDFYGLTGFFVRLVVQESGSGPARVFTIGEKNTGEVLFTGPAKDQAPGKKGDPIRPRFLGGTDLDEPPLAKDTPADPKNITTGMKLPKPAFSRKAKLAAWVTTPENPYFARAIVNRIWAQFMGRGIVHPIDDFNKQNPPSHPELLKALTEGFVAHKFDVQWLIREIVNSNAYQLAMTGTGREALPRWFERARIRPLSAEEIVASMRVATGFDAMAKPGDKPADIGWDYFVRYFGEPTNGQGDFQGSLAEHLFLNNGEHVRRFISRKKGNLAETLITATDPVEMKVERLFLSVLNRPPKTVELDTFTRYLSLKDKPEPLVEDAIWVLLNSSEFRFNH